VPLVDQNSGKDRPLDLEGVSEEASFGCTELGGEFACGGVQVLRNSATIGVADDTRLKVEGCANGCPECNQERKQLRELCARCALLTSDVGINGKYFGYAELKSAVGVQLFWRGTPKCSCDLITHPQHVP
jgi:hypothetical protein